MQDASTQTMARALSSEEVSCLSYVFPALPHEAISYWRHYTPWRGLMAAAMQQLLKLPDKMWSATAQESQAAT